MDRRQTLQGLAATPLGLLLGGSLTKPQEAAVNALANSNAKRVVWVAQLDDKGVWRKIATGEAITEVDAYIANMEAVFEALGKGPSRG